MGDRLTEVAATGDRRRTLEALRDALAANLVAADPANVAALAKQLRETVAELDGLPNAEVVSPVDVLAAKRAARRAVPQDRAAAGGDVQRRPRGRRAGG